MDHFYFSGNNNSCLSFRELVYVKLTKNSIEVILLSSSEEFVFRLAKIKD